MEFAKGISGRDTTRYVNGYDRLHAAMISLSIKAGPRRPVVQASKYEHTRRILKVLRLKDFYGIAGPEERMSADSKRRIGSAFIDVFDEPHPYECSLNKAIMYAVGPKGKGCKGPDREDEPASDETT